MPSINISVAGKIATNTTPGEVVVCGNSDYTVVFSFDTEWQAKTDRVARFRYCKNGKHLYQDVPISDGYSVVDMPRVSDVDQVLVGVYADTLLTTTPAKVLCDRSILCGEPLEEVGIENAKNLWAQIGDLSELNTESTNNLVAAINEVEKKSSRLYFFYVEEHEDGSYTANKTRTEVWEAVQQDGAVAVCYLAHYDSSEPIVLPMVSYRSPGWFYFETVYNGRNIRLQYVYDSSASADVINVTETAVDVSAEDVQLEGLQVAGETPENVKTALRLLATHTTGLPVFCNEIDIPQEAGATLTLDGYMLYPNPCLGDIVVGRNGYTAEVTGYDGEEFTATSTGEQMLDIGIYKDATADYNAWDSDDAMHPDDWPTAAGTAANGFRIPEGRYKITYSRTLYYFDITDSPDGIRRVIAWTTDDDGTPGTYRVHDYLAPGDILNDDNAALIFDLEGESLTIGGKEYLHAKPTRVVLTVEPLASQLIAATKNGVELSFTDSDYSSVYAAIVEAQETGGDVRVVPPEGVVEFTSCTMGVIVYAPDRVQLYCGTQFTEFELCISLSQNGFTSMLDEH